LSSSATLSGNRNSGSDPTLIGRTISLDNEPYTVIGVLPAGEPAEDRVNRQGSLVKMVSPDYFRIVGISGVSAVTIVPNLRPPDAAGLSIDIK
jgi:hypothetical protein